MSPDSGFWENSYLLTGGFPDDQKWTNKILFKIAISLISMQFCKSITFWVRYRSGSGSCYFRLWPSSFFAFYFLRLHLHHFSKIKSHKGSHKTKNQGFSYYFCLIVEGSGSLTRTNESGTRTNGSGSGGPKKHPAPDP